MEWNGAAGCKLAGFCCCCFAGMPVPAQHITESWNSAEFFANKLLREFRGVDEAQVAWVQALKVSLHLQHLAARSFELHCTYDLYCKHCADPCSVSMYQRQR